MTLWEYLQSRQDVLIAQAQEHAGVVAVSMSIATVIGVLVGALTYRTPRISSLAVSLSAAALTIPSFALLGVLIGPLGLGYAPTVVALVVYALLPIIRNTVVGLAEVDPALTEAARGVGMGRLRMLATVEFPIAWPVVLAGIRVSTQMIMGIAAIAAYVGGPGLGNQIFDGLAALGGVNSVNRALVGTLGVVLLALLFDFALVVLGLLTVPRGLRPRRRFQALISRRSAHA
ncbi:ABC transporter permease [Streptomyces sp. NPDC004069]|uniref:ABC transporter permease n=1 Tax=Streptomyces sp. NPDC052043 TaxID=3365684 RepID=UPI0037D1687C